MADWYREDSSIDTVPVNDRGLQYGDGLFETVAIRDGEPRLWPYHWARLQQGCKRLSIRVPSEDSIRARLAAALQLHAEISAYCTAKLVVTAGVGERGYGRARNPAAEVYTGLFASAPPPDEYYRDGVDSIVCETRLAAGSPVAGLKTLNRIEQVLARSEVMTAGVFEGLTMDADDNLICGTMSNVFIVKNQQLVTPGVDRCGVAGVMRAKLLDLLRDDGADVAVASVRHDELRDCDEVFVCNSQFGVIPVKSCGQLVWSVGPFTHQVMSQLADAGIQECRS